MCVTRRFRVQSPTRSLFLLKKCLEGPLSLQILFLIYYRRLFLKKTSTYIVGGFSLDPAPTIVKRCRFYMFSVFRGGKYL